MQKLKSLYLFILSFILLSQVNAQTTEFDSLAFLEEVKSTISLNNKSAYKDLLNDFEVVWFGSKITPDERKQLGKTVHLILEKKLPIKPDYVNYIQAVVNLKLNDSINVDFSNWNSIIDEILQSRRTRNIRPFINTSIILFKNSHLSEVGSISWGVSTSDYDFKLINNKPVISFDKSFNLQCKINDSSLTIYDVSGYYDILSNDWYGNSGKITWENTSLDPNKNYATFNSFKADFKTPGVKIDTVTLVTQFYNSDLQGKLNHRLIISSGKNVDYPNFESFDKRLVVEDIFPSVSYEGGFAIRGEKLMGMGDASTHAKVMFEHHDNYFLEVQSSVFVIKSNQIFAQDAKTKIILDGDSITHPGLKFQYDHKNKEVELLRLDEGKEKSPFFNSYHKLEMDIEAMYWSVGEDSLHMRGMKRGYNNIAKFESSDYFSPDRYYMLGGFSSTHPLAEMVFLTRKFDSIGFNVIAMASTLNLNPKTLYPQLVRLSLYGFIDFDQVSGDIKVLDKTFKYVNSNSEKSDYDNLVWNSDVHVYDNLKRHSNTSELDLEGIDLDSKDNAILSLDSLHLIIRGVEKFTLSEKNNVIVWPTKYEVKMNKNRNFETSAIVDVGKFNFYTDSVAFNYDEFNLHLNKIDSTKFNTLSFPREGSDLRSRYRVKNKLENMQGIVEITDPNNKSGKKNSDYPGYPKFTSLKESFVYFSGGQEEGDEGYDKEEFNFTIAPFEMDSLNDWLPEDLFFEGSFISGGILPEISEKLTIQEDYSLGFKAQAPEEGYPIYENKGSGRFYNEISLSNKGLVGNGEIVYLNAVAKSERFLFLPDSTTGVGSFVHESSKEPIDQAEASGENVQITYHPEKNYLAATGVDAPISIMNGRTALEGTFMVQPSGTTGDGYVEIEQSTIESTLFTFNESKILADTANFKLSDNNDSIVLSTQNVSANIDFETNIADFVANTKNNKLDLPLVEYLCYMDEFRWYMNSDDVEEQGNVTYNNDNTVLIVTELGLDESNFYSVNKKQDSLNFSSARAVYNITNKTLSCAEVPYIDVADVRIVPDSGYVTVREKAKMDSLYNGSIVANSTTRYHNIYKASLKINGKYDYSGNGYTNYVDNKLNSYPIFLEEIKLNNDTITIANGKIDKGTEFKLSPYFDFYGDISLTSENKHMLFQGRTSIVNICDSSRVMFFDFKEEIDPNNVMIPLDFDAQGKNGLPVATGLVLNTQKVSPYPAFMANMSDRSHLNIVKSEGYLRFDEQVSEYQIGSKEKLLDRSVVGNYTSMDIKNCSLYGEGLLNYGMNTSQFKINPYGRLTFNSISQELSMSTVTIFDFPFPEELLNYVYNDISAVENAVFVEADKTYLKKTIQYLFPANDAQEIITDFENTGILQKNVKNKLGTLSFVDLKLNWRADGSRYTGYFANSKLGIGTIGDNSVFKYVDGSVLLNKRRDGVNDIAYIYLKIDQFTWYYFEYQSSTGLFYTLSSNESYNNQIGMLKSDQIEYKGDKEDVKFIINIATDIQVSEYIKRTNN